MVLEKFLIKSFANKPQLSYEVTVPDGAVFTHVVKVLPDGIYAFYRITRLVPADFHRKDTFIILNPGQEIPSNFDLVDILDVTYQNTEAGGNMQGLILFPIFKKA